MHVQIAKFETDGFRLTIQGRSESRDGFAGSSKRFLGGLEKRKTLSETPTESRPDDQAFGTEQQAERKIFQRSAGLINASCLSIIGMIEPGRTVRLYRQIH